MIDVKDKKVLIALAMVGLAIFIAIMLFLGQKSGKLSLPGPKPKGKKESSDDEEIDDLIDEIMEVQAGLS